MKRVIVVAIYEAYVPESIGIENIREKVSDYFERSFEDFGLDFKDDEWIVFKNEGVSVGTEVMVKVSGD